MNQTKLVLLMLLLILIIKIQEKQLFKGLLKILKDRAYQIARNRNYDGYQRALASMIYKFFDKKKGSDITVNEQLVEELHKPIIKKVKRRRVYTRFKGNIWAVDLAEMESLSTNNKIVKYLLCVIDVFTKYA